MTDSPHDRRSWFSRREWLRRAGLAGAAAAVVPIDALVRAGAPRVAAGAGPQADALETLTAAEGVTLTAIVGRLIPSDESGPGAADAGAARYIDRALGDALASSPTACGFRVAGGTVRGGPSPRTRRRSPRLAPLGGLPDEQRSSPSLGTMKLPGGGRSEVGLLHESRSARSR